MTAQHLKALHASVEQAACLSARHDWGRKAAAHAELFNLLADSTADPVLALLVGSATGWLLDLLMAVGPRAEGIILSSRRRLLRLSGCWQRRSPGNTLRYTTCSRSSGRLEVLESVWRPMPVPSIYWTKR